jgi:hypothetical protein
MDHDVAMVEIQRRRWLEQLQRSLKGEKLFEWTETSQFRALEPRPGSVHGPEAPSVVSAVIVLIELMDLYLVRLGTIHHGIPGMAIALTSQYQ